MLLQQWMKTPVYRALVAGWNPDSGEDPAQYLSRYEPYAAHEAIRKRLAGEVY